jgi:hypothetical protein
MGVGEIDLKPAPDHPQQEQGVEPVGEPDHAVVPLDRF